MKFFQGLDFFTNGGASGGFLLSLKKRHGENHRVVRCEAYGYWGLFNSIERMGIEPGGEFRHPALIYP